MFDPGAWRAGVRYEDPLSRSLLVVIGASSPSGATTVITEIGASGPALTRFDEAVEVPALRIPTDAARALYDALAQHFGGTSNSKQLRADYDAERARVDKLTDAVLTIATREA